MDKTGHVLMVLLRNFTRKLLVAVLMLLGPTVGQGAPSSSTLQVGNVGGGGFTQVVPVSPVCQGINRRCKGSQVIYISYDGGTDSGRAGSPGATGTCTRAAPCQTLLYGCSLLRNNSADQLLLKGGDVWPATDHCGSDGTHAVPNLNGLNSCGNVGGGCNGPILFGYYNGSAGRPEIDVDSSTLGGGCLVALGSGGATFNDIVLQGWYCHAIKRDPTNAAYTSAEAENSNLQAINSLAATSWFLVEDCEFAYFSFDISFQPNIAAGTIIVRRSIIVHTYSMGGGKQFSGDSSGILEGGTGGVSGPIVEDSFFYMTGWDNVLTAPQLVTTTGGGAISWPISNYAFNALPFGNGATVYFQNSDSGAGISAGTAYCVLNANNSAGTFEVSATFSGGTSCGSAITGFSSASNTMQWADPCLTLRNHSLYDNDNNGLSTIDNNISIWSNDLMVRPGGYEEGNFLSNDVNEMTSGAFVGCCGGGEPAIRSLTMSGNIFQHTLAFYPGSPGHFSYPGDGGASAAFGIDNATSSGIQMVHNIFSQLGSGSTAINYSCCVSGDTTNTVNQNNIVFSAGASFNTRSAGAGNVTAPQICIDLRGANSGCSDEPFSSPANDLFSYDLTLPSAPGSCTGAGPPNTCMADFIDREIGRGPGLWPANLTAAAVISYVKTGFGNPF